MANFCAIEDVENLLQLQITEDEQIASCLRAIVEATEAIRNYCHQYIEWVEDDEYTFDVDPGCGRLFLPELPVTEVSDVTEDDESLTEGREEDYLVGNFGIIYRMGQNWEPGVQIVTVTYSHGYETIPDDVRAVATRAAARAFQAGLKAEDSDGVPGVVSKSLGDYSVTFGSEAAAEGVLGASAARMLLLSEKDMLNRYRYKRQ